MEDLIGLVVALFVIYSLMWILSKAFQSDLRDLEKTNPRFRKYLKDKYDL